MAFQKVGYSFPHEDDDNSRIEVEDSGAVEIDISDKQNKKPASKSESEDDFADTGLEVEVEVVDDTPKKDRNRKASEPPEEVTDEELEGYSEKVRKRIQAYSTTYGRKQNPKG